MKFGSLGVRDIANTQIPEINFLKSANGQNNVSYRNYLIAKRAAIAPPK